MKQEAKWFLPIREQIVQQIILAIDCLDGDAELIDTIAGWSGTMTDEDVLNKLKHYNIKKLMPHFKTH